MNQTTEIPRPSYEKITFPKKPNYEYVSEYFASKCSAAQRNLGKYNNGDNIERTVEITNYLVRRQLAKTSKKLENRRKDYNEKRHKIQQQWEDLKEKEASLKQNFIKFNVFVKENQEKKDRAVHKIAEQNHLRDDRMKKMAELHKKCEEMLKIKGQMDKNIAQYKIYEDFLSKVIEKEDAMSTVMDLVKRYEALVGARKELNSMQQRDMMKLEKAKSTLKQMTHRYLITMSSMTNHVNELHERYEKARQECKKWERIHKHIKSVTTEKVIETVSIKESIEKMYLEICCRKKIKPTHVNDMEKMLSAIKQAIGEYEIINGRVREIEENAFKESVKAKASGSS